MAERKNRKDGSDLQQESDSLTARMTAWQDDFAIRLRFQQKMG
jgi:hypothetical protein